jgi:hypothetical protein
MLGRGGLNAPEIYFNRSLAQFGEPFTDSGQETVPLLPGQGPHVRIYPCLFSLVDGGPQPR